MKIVRFPRKIWVGDCVDWQDGLALDADKLTYFLRTEAAVGAIAEGVRDPFYWTFHLTSAETTPFTAGDWSFQAIATYGTCTKTVRIGDFTVTPTLAYSGTPDALDLHTKIEKDIQAVEEAIRQLTTGAQEYRIGTAAGGRMVRRAELAELIKWRDRLLADLARQKIAEQIADGQGDPRSLYIRFR